MLRLVGEVGAFYSSRKMTAPVLLDLRFSESNTLPPVSKWRNSPLMEEEPFKSPIYAAHVRCHSNKGRRPCSIFLEIHGGTRALQKPAHPELPLMHSGPPA